MGKVRWKAQDPTQGDLGAIRKVQNKMLRLLNGKRLLDKISTQELLDNLNMLSVNQMNAQIKITEVWKSQNVPNHPFKTEKVCHDTDICTTRAVSNGDLKEFGKTDLLQSTFLSDASKSWNKCNGR